MNFLHLMKKTLKTLRKKVYFNASVILAGLRSPDGGSGKLMNLVKTGKIIGIISEIILDEVLYHLHKIGVTQSKASRIIENSFAIISPPKVAIVNEYKSQVVDEGDAHILASCQEAGVEFLVTLDKKHLLILQNRIKAFRITSPKELIKELL